MILQIIIIKITTMNTTTNEDRAKIVGVGKLRVTARKSGIRERSLRRKVLTNGIIQGEDLADEIGVESKTIQKIVKGIKRIVRAGYEVRLTETNVGSVRFYPCLESDFRTMFLACQTTEGVRDCLGDLKFTITHNGEDIDAEEAEELATNNAKNVEAEGDEVTPDPLVTCPKCGHKFRVGRKI